VSEEKEQDLLTTRQKLSTLETESQKRISDLEYQLTAALSSAVTADSGGQYQLNVSRNNYHVYCD